jgi:lysophospholipase L1-like esterase
MAVRTLRYPRPMRLAALASLFLLAAVAHAQPTDWVEYYRKRVAAHRAENQTLDPAKRYVVLVGDSLTEGWSRSRIQSAMPNIAARVLQRGISSDGVGISARGVKNRLDSSVFDCQPSHIVLHIGVNDIRRDGSNIPNTERTLREVLATIRGRLPTVPIILLRTAPGRGSYATMSPALRRYNDRVQAVATDLGLRTIDLHALFAGSDGLLRPELSSDGLHWTAAAYALLGPEIERAVGASGPVTPPPVATFPATVETQASTLNVRDGPMGTVLGTVPRGTRLQALELRDGWFRVRWNGREAWISATYARRVTGLAGTLPGN